LPCSLFGFRWNETSWFYLGFDIGSCLWLSLLQFCEQMNKSDPVLLASGSCRKAWLGEQYKLANLGGSISIVIIVHPVALPLGWRKNWCLRMEGCGIKNLAYYSFLLKTWFSFCRIMYVLCVLIILQNCMRTFTSLLLFIIMPRRGSPFVE
jgi:hypothetical protein